MLVDVHLGLGTVLTGECSRVAVRDGVLPHIFEIAGDLVPYSPTYPPGPPSGPPSFDLSRPLLPPRQHQPVALHHDHAGFIFVRRCVEKQPRSKPRIRWLLTTRVVRSQRLHHPLELLLEDRVVGLPAFELWRMPVRQNRSKSVVLLGARRRSSETPCARAYGDAPGASTAGE